MEGWRQREIMSIKCERADWARPREAMLQAKSGVEGTTVS